MSTLKPAKNRYDAACEARTATDIFRKRRDHECAASELRSFVTFHSVNYLQLETNVHPFDKLPTELIFQILKHVANHNLRMEARIVSPHILKARLIQRRLATAADKIILRLASEGLFLVSQFPTETRKLRNLLAASRNKAMRTLLHQIHVPVALQTMRLDTITTWTAKCGARPARQHNPWTLRATPIRDYVNLYKETRGMYNILDDHFNDLIDSFEQFENLDSLKIQTIPHPPQYCWTKGPICIDAPTLKPYLGNNYDHVARLFDLVAESNLTPSELVFIGLAPALLESAFCAKLQSWSFFEYVNRLNISLLDGESFDHVDSHLLIPFFSKFHSLENIEMRGNSLNRCTGTSEYSVQLILNVFYIRPRPFLTTLNLRRVSCYGWTLRNFCEEHERCLQYLELDDITLFDTMWYRLLNYIRHSWQKRKILRTVSISQSRDLNLSTVAFYDEEYDYLMREIVAKYGHNKSGQISLGSYIGNSPLNDEASLGSED